MKIIAAVSLLSIMGLFSSLFNEQEIPVQVIEFTTPLVITSSK